MWPMVKSLARRAGLQQPWLQTSRIPGRITQLLDDLTAVIGWRTWAERVFILPILCAVTTSGKYRRDHYGCQDNEGNCTMGMP